MGRLVIVTLYCVLLTNLWWMTFTIDNLHNSDFIVVPVLMSIGAAIVFVAYCSKLWDRNV